MPHANRDICRWPKGPEACEEDSHGCLPCKLRGWSNGGFQISPAALPNKEKKFHPVGVPKGENSFGRPVVTDSRGMPLMKADGEYIRHGEYAARHGQIERARRDLANGAPLNP